MNKFLVINPFGIGDVLFTTPVIRAIKEDPETSLVSYWCNQRVEPVLKNNPCIDETFALSRGDIKRALLKSKLGGMSKALNLFNRIKRGHFDIAFDFSLDHRYGLTAKLAGIKRRIGFNYKNRGRFLTDKINIDGYSDRHIVEYYSELLKFLNILPKGLKLELFVNEEQKIEARGLLGSLGVAINDLAIGIAPGGGESWGKDALFKHWPAVKFAELSDRLINDLNAKVIILGDKSEMPIADMILKSMRNKAINLAGETSLLQLAGIINELNLLVSNDGGPLHMAVALGVNTVSMFGPVDDLVYGPYPPGENHIVLKSNLPCRPCYKNFRFTGCSENHRCLDDITVESAYSASRRLL